MIFQCPQTPRLVWKKKSHADFCEETFCHPKTGTPKNSEPQKADFQLRFLGANQVEGSLSIILSQKVFDRFLLISGKVSKKFLPIKKGSPIFSSPSVLECWPTPMQTFLLGPNCSWWNEFLLTTEGVLAECCKVVGIYYILSFTFARLKHLNINQFWNTLISETSESAMFFLRWPKPLSPSGSWDDANHLHDNAGESAQAEKKVIAKSEYFKSLQKQLRLFLNKNRTLNDLFKKKNAQT